MQSPPLNERAKLLADLEHVLAQNPRNRQAGLRLRSMGADIPVRPISPMLDAERVNAPNVATARTDASAEGKANVRAKRVQDLALRDPTYGRVLAGKSPEDRAVAYATLIQTDPEFRNRQRALAEAQQE
jgi:hypothetical protein